MWITAALAFFKSNTIPIVFVSVLVILLGVVVIPNFDQIREKMGFETRTSLKAEVVQQQADIENLKASNESLDATIKKVEENAQVNTAAVIEQQVVVAEVKKQIDTVIAAKTEKIKQIHLTHTTKKVQKALKVKRIPPLNKVSKKPHTPHLSQAAHAPPRNVEDSHQSVAQEVSQVQIDAIWSVYCGFNTSGHCPAPTVPQPTGSTL